MSAVMEMPSLIIKGEDKPLIEQVWSNEDALVNALDKADIRYPEVHEVRFCEDCKGFTCHGEGEYSVDRCEVIGGPVWQDEGTGFGCHACETYTPGEREYDDYEVAA